MQNNHNVKSYLKAFMVLEAFTLGEPELTFTEVVAIIDWQAKKQTTKNSK